MSPNFFARKMGKKKSEPRWRAASRFARALLADGFLPQRHFVDRIAERGLGSGIRFDARSFRREFDHAKHYRQTRPGYSTRIAVVRDVPILYRKGGATGKKIVLVGALPPTAPLPPVESIVPPSRRDQELIDIPGELEQKSVGTISATEYLKWVQRSLNRIYGLTLATDGNDSKAYRAAVRRFNLEYTGRDYAEVDEETQNHLIFVNEAPGPYVGWVVQALNGAGLGPLGSTDAYTPEILAALKNFQRSQKPPLKADGFVGSKTELALIQASHLTPPGEKKPRPKRPPRRDDPTPEKRHRFIVVRGDTPDEVRALALRSAKAAFAAQKRFEYLANLPLETRRKEWNRSHEREWFGLYAGSRRAPFLKVKKRIDLIAAVFRGRRNYGNTHRHDRIDLLTIESFNCSYPGAQECHFVEGNQHPVLRWEKGRTPEERLEIEAKAHLKDRVYFCCFERDTLGIAFRARTRLDHPRDLIDLKVADRPHKIALCPGWFTPPPGRRMARVWARDRETTIAHEVAHLAGAMRLRVGLDLETGKRVLVNAEVYRPLALRTLARIRPFLARLNAENYGKYIMEFGKE